MMTRRCLTLTMLACLALPLTAPGALADEPQDTIGETSASAIETYYAAGDAFQDAYGEAGEAFTDAQHTAYETYLTAYHEGPKTLGALQDAAFAEVGPAYDAAFAQHEEAQRIFAEHNPCGGPPNVLPLVLHCFDFAWRTVFPDG